MIKRLKVYLAGPLMLEFLKDIQAVYWGKKDLTETDRYVCKQINTMIQEVGGR